MSTLSQDELPSRKVNQQVRCKLNEKRPPVRLDVGEGAATH